jgi:hypothetical protein
VRIPAGTLRAGSLPGTAGRKPRFEADLVPVALPEFHIDRLPYPNDPNRPPLGGKNRQEAESLCGEEGKRLCSELEWERACEGDRLSPFPGGESFDVEGCSLEPLSCSSPFGVVSMGVFGFEWTASDVNRGLGSSRYSASVRGGRVTDEPSGHRCAARHALAPGEAGPGILFRCCRGSASETPYPGESSRPTFASAQVELDVLRTILRTVPQLAPYANDFTPFSAEEVDQALSRNDLGRESLPWNFPTGVLEWSPEQGERVWVVAGTGAGSSVVAALYPLPDGSYVHAASFVLKDEPVPVALAWDDAHPLQIHWTACWGCPGEGGTVDYRPEDGRVVVVHR